MGLHWVAFEGLGILLGLTKAELWKILSTEWCELSHFKRIAQAAGLKQDTVVVTLLGIRLLSNYVVHLKPIQCCIVTIF